MSFDAGLYDWVCDGLAPLGSVTMRRMMGGATLYLDGIVFALLDGEALWLKSDAVSDPLWEAEGCAKFDYQFPNGKRGTMNYRRAPDGVYDDVEALQHWSQLAVEAGMRAAAKKKGKV